jgi:hypothetical protein
MKIAIQNKTGSQNNLDIVNHRGMAENTSNMVMSQKSILYF